MNTTQPHSSSKRMSTLLTIGLVASIVAIVAMAIDQSGGNSVADHSREIYLPLGKDPNPGAIWAILYSVFIVGALGWAATLWGSIRKFGWIRIGVTTAFVIGSFTLAYLSVASEYGSPILPESWRLVCGAMALYGLVTTVFAWLPGIDNSR